MIWPVIAMLLAALAAGLLFLDWGDTPEKNSKPAGTSAVSTPQEVVRLSKEDLATLNKRVKEFSRLYFSYGPERDAEEVKRSVVPYSTKSFLETADFSLGRYQNGIDQGLDSVTVTTVAVSSIVGAVMDAKTVTGSVTLRVTVTDTAGRVVNAFDRQQEMKWVKPHNAWLISEAPLT